MSHLNSQDITGIHANNSKTSLNYSNLFLFFGWHTNSVRYQLVFLRLKNLSIVFHIQINIIIAHGTGTRVPVPNSIGSELLETFWKKIKIEKRRDAKNVYISVIICFCRTNNDVLRNKYNVHDGICIYDFTLLELQYTCILCIVSKGTNPFF